VNGEGVVIMVKTLTALVVAAVLATALSGCTQPPPRPLFGLSLGNTLHGMTDDDLTAELRDVRALGVQAIRVDLDWNDVQPAAAGPRDWAAFDRTAARALEQGLRVLPIVTYTPPWARAPGCRADQQCHPADPATFAAFAGAAVARYAPLGVRTWEVWNEPNVAGFWSPRANSAEYAAVLRAAVTSMRAADPAITIVSAGLAPAATDPARGDIAPLRFLSEICAAGALDGVDAVGFHPYSYPVPPGYPEPWNAWIQMTDPDTGAAAVLAACGAGAKPLWATEYGAPTNGPGSAATVGDYGLDRDPDPDHVDEALQAQIATESARAVKDDPRLAALFWYSYQDLGTDAANRENFFGLRRADRSTKPAWDAWKAAIAP
jgi:hypothetical protein